MDCITISDDTSSPSLRSAPNVFNSPLKRDVSVASLPISIDSESTQRCPVTWSGDRKRRRPVTTQFTNNNVTPLVNTRVKMWLASTMQLQQSPAVCSPPNDGSFGHSDSGSDSSSIDRYYVRNARPQPSPNRSILIKHDFSRSNEVASDICVSQYKPRWEYSDKSAMLNGHCDTKEIESESNKETSCCSVGNDEGKDEESEEKDKDVQKLNNNEVPLSPETQKKNELCSYLQLMNMNCPDHKMASKIQNRRSTRVKNLIIMSEKKELERKLNIEAKRKEEEDSTVNIEQEQRQRSLIAKSFEELNIKLGQDDEREEVDETKQEAKLLNIQDIPLGILMKRSDFDETMKVFIDSEGCGFKSKEMGGESQEMKGRKYVRKKKYPNGNLKALSSPRSLLSKTKLKLKQSPRLYRRKLRNLPSRPEEPLHTKNETSSTKTEAPSLKGKEAANPKPKKKYINSIKRKSFRKILVPRAPKKNLRSRLNLCDVGIKALILKDKKYTTKKRLRMKPGKKIVLKNQKKATTKVAMVKPSENFTRKAQESETSTRDKSDEVDSFSHDDIEIISLANSFSYKPMPVVKRKLDEEFFPSATEEIKTKIKTVLHETPKTQDFPNGSKQNCLGETTSLSGPRKCEESNSFNEKAFSIIDLSHSTVAGNIDTLNDHDYSLKSPQDKGYIMNVILANNQKSPIMESIESKSVIDDNYCKSSEDLSVSVSKEQEYCRETLEEIIGIPFRQAMKKDAKSKEEETSLTSDNKETENQLSHSFPQYDYSSYQNSLLLKPASPNKMFNLRLPLLEPPSNIFDEESCSPSRLDHPDESHQEIPSEIDGKPQIITATVPSEMKSLHKSLMQGKRKSQVRNSELLGESSNHTWDDSSCEDKRSHSIKISAINGDVVNAFYVDFNLVVVQEQSVQFWCQSALGNMLGSQDLWISKGSLQRLVLDNTCVFKESSDMVISMENSFAYVELWTKEHKSDKRERPLADVFATVYFWRHRQNGPNRKFLQLENINGKGSDVQYIVLRNSRSIVVSWVEIRDDMKKTVVHCYSLAADYQTVTTIREMDTVDHCVTSLHNIEECTSMVMGFGEEHVTLWNLEYGYVVATIEIKSISANPRCVWVKCDRGFLFLLQYHEIERLLVLIAVNGISHSWKRLQVFRAPYGYDGLRGVCIDNNVLAAFYQRGVLCWNIQSGESVIEEMSSQTTYLPCDKHIVMLNSDKAQVQQFLSYFVTSFDLQ